LNDNCRNVRRSIENEIPMFQNNVLLANRKETVAELSGNANELTKNTSQTTFAQTKCTACDKITENVLNLRYD